MLLGASSHLPSLGLSFHRTTTGHWTRTVRRSRSLPQLQHTAGHTGQAVDRGQVQVHSWGGWGDPRNFQSPGRDIRDSNSCPHCPWLTPGFPSPPVHPRVRLHHPLWDGECQGQAHSCFPSPGGTKRLKDSHKTGSLHLHQSALAWATGCCESERPALGRCLPTGGSTSMPCMLYRLYQI